MKREAILKLLSKPEELAKVSIDELQVIADKYPYFNQLQILLQQKIQQLEAGSDSFNDHTHSSTYQNTAQNQSIANEYKQEDEQDDLEFNNLEEEDRHLPFYDDNFKPKPKSDCETKNEADKKAIEPTPLSNEELDLLLKKAGEIEQVQADDLTLIPSIDAGTQQRLNGCKLFSYSQLKHLNDSQDLNILSKITGLPIDKIKNWQIDCLLLYQNKYHRMLLEKVGVVLVEKQNDLQQIIGIGTVTERKLHALGILNYQQIANLEPTEIDILTNLIQYFPDRIKRDEWVEQAKLKLEELSKVTSYESDISENNGISSEDTLHESPKLIAKTEPGSEEINKLKAKLEAHKSLRQEIGVTSVNSNLTTEDDDTQTHSKESFRDWLNRMNKTSDASDEKKNLLVNDSTSLPPI